MRFLPVSQVSQKELSEIFGVTDRTVRNWEAADPDFPPARVSKGKASTYDTVSVIEWYARRGEEDALSLEQERAKLARVQRVGLEMKNAIASVEQVDTAAVLDILTTILITTRTRLLGISRKAAPRVVGITETRLVQAEIDVHVREALENVAPDLLFEAVGVSGYAPAAADSGSEAMGGPVPVAKPRE